MIDSESLQAPFACLFNVSSITSDSAPADPKLAAKKDLVSLAGSFEPESKKILVISVDIGSIPERAAQLKCSVQDSECVFVVLSFAVTKA
jgi:hypothetical protein